MRSWAVRDSRGWDMSTMTVHWRCCATAAILPDLSARPRRRQPGSHEEGVAPHHRLPPPAAGELKTRHSVNGRLGATQAGPTGGRHTAPAASGGGRHSGRIDT
jgi:hypothetical protein